MPAKEKFAKEMSVKAGIVEPEQLEMPEIEVSDKARAHVMISGIVQGVFFRSTLRSQAKLLGVKGWAKNAPNGNVEALFEGKKENVERIVNFCWKGPPGAFVRDVNIEWQKPKLDMGGFDIL